MAKPKIHMGLWYDGRYVTCCRTFGTRNLLIVRREDEWSQVTCAYCLRNRAARAKRRTT